MLKFINQELDNFNGNVNEIRDVGDLLRKSYLFFITNLKFKKEITLALGRRSRQGTASGTNASEAISLRRRFSQSSQPARLGRQLPGVTLHPAGFKGACLSKYKHHGQRVTAP
jgi:hypothetical protein